MGKIAGLPAAMLGQPAVLVIGTGTPEPPTMKVSSDFAPRTVGFQANAVPAAIVAAAASVPGTTSNSRDR